MDMSTVPRKTLLICSIYSRLLDVLEAISADDSFKTHYVGNKIHMPFWWENIGQMLWKMIFNAFSIEKFNKRFTHAQNILLHNVAMGQLFQKSNFTNCGTRHTISFSVRKNKYSNSIKIKWILCWNFYKLQNDRHDNMSVFIQRSITRCNIYSYTPDEKDYCR